MTTVKSSGKLTLKDRLSRLTFLQACKLLGPEGKKLIQQGGMWQFKLDEDVYLGDDLFRLKFPCADRPGRADRHDHADGRGPRSPALALRPLPRRLRARRRGVFADARREDCSSGWPLRRPSACRSRA